VLHLNLKLQHMRSSVYIYTLALALATVLMFSSSCKKDDDDPSNTDKITGKNFVMTAWTIDPPVDIGAGPFSDLFALLPACTKDDITVFNADGTMTLDEGASKCEQGDPQTTSGTWSFIDNETKLSTTVDGNTQVMDIVELTENTLRLSYEETEDYGDGEKTYTNTITFTAN
jgi:hypothetical protein